MGFNFGGFMGGMAEGIHEGIEKEEERINMLADKAYDQYTQDYRDNKAKREAAKKAAEAYMFQLKDAGYDIPTSAHIARYGEGAVKSAVAKAKEHGDTHDISTLYSVAPDPSTKDFTEGQWLDMIVGASTTKIDPSSYMGKSGGAADYRTLFSGSARDVFNERVKATNMGEAIPTAEGTFGTMTPLRLTSKEVKTYNSFEGMLVGLTQRIVKETDPETKKILQGQYDATMSDYIKFKNAKESEGKETLPFSKESISSIIRERRRAMFSGNIVKSVGTEIQLMISGNEAEYIDGMDRILDNLTEEFVGEGKINDPLMNSRIKSEERNLEKIKTNYATSMKNTPEKAVEKNPTAGARYHGEPIVVPKDEAVSAYVEKEIRKGDYRAGDVITYKEEKGITKIFIYTGTAMLPVNTNLVGKF